MMLECQAEVRGLMRAITILPKSYQNLAAGYQALAGCQEATGATMGAALDALTAQLPEPQANTLVIIQPQLPDEFFTAAQQKRLADLMAAWRTARDTSQSLPPALQEELDALVDLELSGATQRADAFLQELAP